MPGTLFSEAEADVQQRDRAEVVYPGRSRAYYAPMPELDIAWLVRFLMAMFGWLGAVVGGGGADGGTVARGETGSRKRFVLDILRIILCLH